MISARAHPSVCDVAIAGGGPAGAVAAIVLARLELDVVVIDGSAPDEVPIGETLTPDARPALARLGLENAIEPPGAIPSYGNASRWGAEELEQGSFLFHPYGHGWHLDRRRFDASLRATAAAAGARVACGVHVSGAVLAPGDRWRLQLDGGAEELSAHGVIDATGRRAALSRTVGARRDVRDHLVGVAVRYASARGDASPTLAADGSHTLVESTRDGWWYSAQLPSGEIIVVHITDADVCRQGRLGDANEFRARISRVPATARRIGSREPRSSPRVCSAVVHRLRRDSRMANWLAAGDAAISVDPLSSSGLLYALIGGEAAAQAMAHSLLGRPEAATDYERALDAIFEAHGRERAAVYSRERRWLQAPFWSRRRCTEEPSGSGPP